VNGEHGESFHQETSREMELGYASRLLLDFGKGCPYHGIQATGKTVGGNMILCVLNNELTRKKECADVQFTL